VVSFFASQVVVEGEALNRSDWAFDLQSDFVRDNPHSLMIEKRAVLLFVLDPKR
jgi:hypothetical protein